ncbi:hypothetical protein J1N35_005786, partial [Gossypium stocksii]
ISFQCNIGMWLKSYHSVEHEDDDIDATFEDFSVPKHAPQLTFSLRVVQPSPKVNSAILDAIHFLSNNV